jgi:hypothetical protein
MRKLLAIIACLASFSLIPINASAGGAFSITMPVHSLFLPLLGPPPPGTSPNCPFSPLGILWVSTSGNGVIHFNANGTGDWFTTTFEGDSSLFPVAAVVPPAAPGAPPTIVPGPLTAQGHLTTWFGGETNNQNNVFHFTLNFQGTEPTGQALAIHANFDATMNANGQMTATVTNVTCS